MPELKEVTFVTLGGTIACSKNDRGFLEPTLKVNDLVGIVCDRHPDVEFKKDAEGNVLAVAPYNIDSQAFDISVHVKKVEEALRDNEGDLIVTSGTDTVKWLAAVIKNYEERRIRDGGKLRAVNIITSMYAPVDDMGKGHVANLIRAAVERKEPGVYLGCAMDEEAKKVVFYDADYRVTKIKSEGFGAVVGGRIAYEMQFDDGNELTTTGFKNKLLLPHDKSIVDSFIEGCVMSKLPTLGYNSSEAIRRYLSSSKRGEIVAIEVDKNWFEDDGRIKEDYKNVVTDLVQKGVKVLLNPRCPYRDGQFKSVLSDEQIERVNGEFVDLAEEGEAMVLCSKINATAVYAKIASNTTRIMAAASTDSFESLIVGEEDEDKKDDYLTLGLRYVPHFPICCRTYNRLQRVMKNGVVVMEALPGGVVSSDLLQRIDEFLGLSGVVTSPSGAAVDLLREETPMRHDFASPSYPMMLLCGAYDDGKRHHKVYEASASKHQMRRLHMTDVGGSALDWMRYHAVFYSAFNNIDRFLSTVGKTEEMFSPMVDLSDIAKLGADSGEFKLIPEEFLFNVIEAVKYELDRKIEVGVVDVARIRQCLLSGSKYSAIGEGKLFDMINDDAQMVDKIMPIVMVGAAISKRGYDVIAYEKFIADNYGLNDMELIFISDLISRVPIQRDDEVQSVVDSSPPKVTSIRKEFSPSSPLLDRGAKLS